MKAFFRSPAVQGTLAFLLAAWLKFCIATTRWTQENLSAAEAVWDAKGPVIVCFWHARISISPACWPLGRAQQPRALISLSRDGEFIAHAVARLGFPAIRGSSSKSTKDGEKVKGGAGAFRDVLRWLKGGGGIAITPDGPRGPAETMAEGAALLAKVSKAPVLLVGLACSPSRRLNSWDRAVLPLPFGKGAIVWDGPIRDVAEDTEALRQEWARRLTAATERAEALVR